MKSVAGKTVLVTGAAMGMGKLYARRAVEEGATDVVLWDINEEALAATAGELSGSGTRIHSQVVDVSSDRAIAAASQVVRDEVGTVEILVNNAGIVPGNNYFWESGTGPIEKTMAINALAPMLIAREFLPGMIEAPGECRVLNMASAAGLVPVSRLAVYASSKWAAIGWSDSVRLELEQAGHDHVKVTTVCPLYVNTGMFEGAKGPLFTPMLKPADVVDDAWKHMLKGEAFLVTPWTSRLAKVLSGVLPTKLRDIALDITGTTHSMDDFTGHDKQ